MCNKAAKHIPVLALLVHCDLSTWCHRALLLQPAFYTVWIGSDWFGWLLSQCHLIAISSVCSLIGWLFWTDPEHQEIIPEAEGRSPGPWAGSAPLSAHGPAEEWSCLSGGGREASQTCWEALRSGKNKRFSATASPRIKGAITTTFKSLFNEQHLCALPVNWDMQICHIYQETAVYFCSVEISIAWITVEKKTVYRSKLKRGLFIRLLG